MILLDNALRSGRFCIKYDLDSVEDAPSWGDPGTCRLHWFGLTSGRFWIDTSSGNLLEYTTAIQEAWSLPGDHPDYYVARLFEDLLSILPAILEPVPATLLRESRTPAGAPKVNNGVNQPGTPSTVSSVGTSGMQPRDGGTTAPWIWDTSDMPLDSRSGGWTRRYFSSGRRITKRTVSQYGPSPKAKSQSMCRPLNLPCCQELLEAMEQRVRTIQRDGWKRTDCTLDVDALAHEQAARRDFFQKMRHEKQVTDWQKVRASLHAMIALIEG